MRRVAITGGAGFIGSHLAEALVARGDAVTIVDDFSTGSAANLAAIADAPAVTIHTADVCDRALMTDLLAGCELVYHLAARIGVKLVVQSPLRTLEANVDGTASVLHAARAAGAAVVVASTSEVYGLATSFPSAEDDPITIGAPTRGRWSYAASKAVDEFYAIATWREFGLPVSVVRLFNTVGPRQSARYGMVIPRFVDQALRAEPLTIYGDGRQTRSFCHVHDVVCALLRLGRDASFAGEVFNIGNPHEVTIDALAGRVLALTGSRSRRTYVPFAEAYDETFQEIVRRVPDIAKARRLLGFAPVYDLDAILRDVIAERSAPAVRA